MDEFLVFVIGLLLGVIIGKNAKGKKETTKQKKLSNTAEWWIIGITIFFLILFFGWLIWVIFK